MGDVVVQRFRVIVFGDEAFQAATYDQVYSRIFVHHHRRQKACGFHVDFFVKHYDLGDSIPYSSGYAIVDNYIEQE